MAGIPFPGRFIDIGIPEDYRIADAHLGAWMDEDKRKVIFLDRDGVINIDLGYVADLNHLRFLDGAMDFMRAARGLGYELVVVTNQAGIAKGKYTEAEYHAFMDGLLERLHAQRIDVLDSYYCPFHPEGVIGEYRKDSFDRKPAPGMILKAAEKHSVDLFSSWMVGDKDSDRIDLPYLRSLVLRGSHEARQDPYTCRSFEEMLEIIKNA